MTYVYFLSFFFSFRTAKCYKRYLEITICLLVSFGFWNLHSRCYKGAAKELAGCFLICFSVVENVNLIVLSRTSYFRIDVSYTQSSVLLRPLGYVGNMMRGTIILLSSTWDAWLVEDIFWNTKVYNCRGVILSKWVFRNSIWMQLYFYLVWKTTFLRLFPHCVLGYRFKKGKSFLYKRQRMLNAFIHIPVSWLLYLK